MFGNFVFRILLFQLYLKTLVFHQFYKPFQNGHDDAIFEKIYIPEHNYF